jgi:protein-S-isoprenylcysteine O-methyltransferase Ste14
MRAKKRSNVLKARVILAVANHAAMGVACGLVLALILIGAPFFGIRALIDMSDDPTATMAMFVGTVVVTFGIGAAFTGAILMMEDA